MKPTFRLSSFRSRRIDPARVWLAVMLLLALGVRVHHLATQSLWYDEAVTAQVSAQSIAELTRWTAADIQPPLYYYAAAGWTRLAGRSEWALRFPSATFGVLTVALLWGAARRLFGRRAAGLTALLAALSPLYIYYAQEARMYTLLTALGVLTGYALLRAAADGRSSIVHRPSSIVHRPSSIVHRPSSAKWWAAFVLAAVAMLYTHYFGAFLLAAYGLCFLIGWLAAAGRDRRQWRALGGFAISLLAIATLYLPWLPAMLNRYRVDASYWQGALKLDEALRHVAISFTVAAPEMMLEGSAVRLLPWFGLALLSAVLALVLLSERQRGGNARRALACLSICLLVPILCVLFLASRTPKFNPRYLMMASPAYVLILAGGMGMLWGGAEEEQRSSGAEERRRAQIVVRRVAVFLFSGFLVATALVSLRSWFTDPAFSKAQWREVAAYVRQERAASEAVLLVSGHAYPAWDYYAADIPRVRLPKIEILDVDARLGFEVGDDLTSALADKSGAWLVTWQDDVVDPVGFVPFLLDRAGSEQPVPRQFWHLGLRHWQVAPGAIFPTEPQPQRIQTANFDHKLALLGWDDPRDGLITVYWRTLNTLPVDYKVSLVLEDAAGREIGRWDGRPAGYGYPTTRWRPGEALFGRYRVTLPAGAAAGDYFFALAVYSDADPSGLDIRDVADNPAGKRVRLGPVKLGF